MKLTILAFLQNPWFPNGTAKTLVSQHRTDQEFRQDLLKVTGTGWRLQSSFGEDMFRRIWWDYASPHETDHPKKRSVKNQDYVDKVIAERRPDLILTFGEEAERAVRDSVVAIKKKIMCCHHPNARYRPQADLDVFAQDVWDYVLVMERKDEFTAGDKE
jgi:hypothetical protein